MFLRKLEIKHGNGTTIRHIPFKLGLNLIVDETPLSDETATGNNVGKTTVLRLIDFCLGAKPNGIYSDPENPKNEYKLVKDYLIKNEVLISLTLCEDLAASDSEDIVIERNFLSRKNKIQRFNGVNKTDEDFDKSLTELLFPGHYGNKPTFRQIISHNIRYKDLSLSNTIKHLDSFTRDDEYETLYLFLLGCSFDKGVKKQEIRTKLDLEERFKKRIEADQTKSGYETSLMLLNLEIEELNVKKSLLRVNPHFERDVELLNRKRFSINRVVSEMGRLELRRSLILEAKDEMTSTKSDIDLAQLEQIYSQAGELIKNVHVTFSELCAFHNKMVQSKINFISDDLPRIEEQLINLGEELQQLLLDEQELSGVVTQSDSFEELESLINELNERHRKKGEFKNVIDQLNSVDRELAILNDELSAIDNSLFSADSLADIQSRLNEFNKYFSVISNDLYGEKYALKVDMKKSKDRRLYEFTTFNTNFSSGKKQGEISCFDIAYTLFADNQNIRCMHFLLNDKRELMHDNQLVKIARLVNEKGLQFVASILKDKLPQELNKDEFIAVKLSQDDKLFRIEQSTEQE